MIPTAIALGLGAGLTRFRWWSIPVIGVIWSIMLSIGGDPSMSFAQIWVAGFLLGGLNGAVGVLASWSVVYVLSWLFRWVRSRWGAVS